MTEQNFPGKFPRNFLEDVVNIGQFVLDTEYESDDVNSEQVILLTHLIARAHTLLDASPTHERVPFRLILMPCCGHLLCWVNPRFPTYCPSCGANVYPEVRSAVLHKDDEAILTFFASKEEVKDGGKT